MGDHAAQHVSLLSHDHAEAARRLLRHHHLVCHLSDHISQHVLNVQSERSGVADLRPGLSITPVLYFVFI